MIVDSPLVAAVQFLTRLPLRVETTEHARREAPRFYPLVGAVVSLLGAAVHLAVAPRAAALAPVLGVLATVVATGGLHEDGLADTADAYGLEKERARAVLKDPRLGTHGVLALVASLAVRVAAAASLTGPLVVLGYASAGALGRAGAVVVMNSLPYAFDDGARRTADGAHTKPAHLLGAALVVVALGVASFRLGAGVPFAVALALAALVVGATTRRLRGWLAGTTGDTLGAVEQLVEIAVFVGFALAGAS